MFKGVIKKQQTFIPFENSYIDMQRYGQL